MEPWRKVWRDGFVPSLSTAGLEALRTALMTNDGRLLQGATTFPPPMPCVQKWPVEATCAVGFCAWHGEGLDTVGEVEEFFVRSCQEADERLREPGACGCFLDWFDNTSRDLMRHLLLDEVNLALSQRVLTEVSSHGCTNTAS